MSLIIWYFGGQESRSAILGALKVLTEIIAISTHRRGWCWYGGTILVQLGTVGTFLVQLVHTLVHLLQLLIVPQFVSSLHLCTSAVHEGLNYLLLW